jgi:hypothetical protein
MVNHGILHQYRRDLPTLGIITVEGSDKRIKNCQGRVMSCEFFESLIECESTVMDLYHVRLRAVSELNGIPIKTVCR